MYIPNDNIQYYPICRLKLVVVIFGLKEPTNESLKEVSKVLDPPNKKTLLYNFGNSVIMRM